MESKNSPSNTQFPDLDNGWAWVVLVASFCSFMLLGATMYAVGIIHLALLERYQEKVQVGKDQEKAQSEKDSHSKNRGGKKPN